MFDFGLLNPLPWEDGIEPDASNDIADVYIERRFTKELKTHDAELIKSMKRWYVALVKFRDGEIVWIISDGIGVLDKTYNLESLGVVMDKWKLIERS